MTARHPDERPGIHEVALALREMFTSEIGRHRLVQEPEPAGAPMLAVEPFDHLTALAAGVFGAPLAILATPDRLWLCNRLADEPADPRALLDRAAAAAAGLHFALSVPLPGGDERGALWVLDAEDRDPTPRELAALEDLAAIAARELDGDGGGPVDQARHSHQGGRARQRNGTRRSTGQGVSDGGADELDPASSANA
jgi:hypothetical protein